MGVGADVVRAFWGLMASNRFDSVGQVLADEFVLEWPLSNERIVGRVKFGRMNAEYPAHGPWRFDLHRLVEGPDGQVVTDTGVTDGVVSARAISFFTVDPDRRLIVRLVEFWPEPTPAAENRRHLTEPMG